MKTVTNEKPPKKLVNFSTFPYFMKSRLAFRKWNISSNVPQMYSNHIGNNCEVTDNEGHENWNIDSSE